MPKLSLSATALALLALPYITAAQNSKTDTVKLQQLKEVSVSAVREAIEVRPGKTVVNVQALSGASGRNALELLRRIPGLQVDGRGNITMTGRQGVMVMINGRRTYLTGDDLRDFLEGLTAEEIAQIEIMEQPSAAYDASGNAGIVNLKLRRLRKHGFNGNANLAWTKSLYENTHNTALVNYNTGTTNWYAGANYVNGRNGVGWTQNMIFTDPAGNPTAHSILTSQPREMYDKYNLRAGLDHTCSEHTTIGGSATGAYNANTMNTPIITTTSQGGNEVYSIRHTNEHSLRRNITANGYIKHSFKQKQELTADVDYLRYTKSLYQYLTTEATQNGVPLPDQLTLRSHVPLTNTVYNAKADYTTPVNDKIKLECGTKYNYATVTNDPSFQTISNRVWTDDSTRSNTFRYREHIAALYASGNMKLNEQWSVQMGLRGEYAHIHGVQEVTGATFTRSLPALFPTLYVTWKPNEDNVAEVNYGRRIERPAYSMLNPFNYYTFYNTYLRGNPDLLPQYSHNATLRHSYKHRITTAIDISHTTDNVVWLNMPEAGTVNTYNTPVNFGSCSNASLGITYNGKPATWCEVTLHSKGIYALYKGIINNVPAARAKAAYNLWLNSRFILGSGWQADCYVSYTSDRATSPVGNQAATLYSNLGVQKKVLHDTTTIRVSLDDPFFIYRNHYEDIQPSLTTTSDFMPNSRYCTMSVAYNFGRNDNKIRRHRTEADEIKRM